MLVSSFGNGFVDRIDLSTDRVTQRFFYGGNPEGITYDDAGNLFVKLGTRTHGDAIIAQINPSTGSIIHERTGLLVAPKDVQQLADALARVCGDHLLRERLARAAREFAAANLTWRISAARYVRLYEEVLEAWPASRTTIPTRTRYAS